MDVVLYLLTRVWASSSVSWSPWRTLLILSEGCINVNAMRDSHSEKEETERERDWRMNTWRERVAEAETVAEESGGGTSDQVRRSEVEVCGFLTGVLALPCILFYALWVFSWAECEFDLNAEEREFFIYLFLIRRGTWIFKCGRY